MKKRIEEERRLKKQKEARKQVFIREGPGHRPKGLSQQITTFDQTFSLFKPVPSLF